jgi:hypothetical protein
VKKTLTISLKNSKEAQPYCVLARLPKFLTPFNDLKEIASGGRNFENK